VRRLRFILAELYGLFVDDGRFALAILAWIGFVWKILPWLGLAPWAAGPALFAGLAVILFEGAWRRARHAASKAWSSEVGKPET
jgi:hypothetical protein